MTGSLIDLWPRPLPDECHHGPWLYVMPKITGLKGPVFRCSSCNQEATPLPGDQWYHLRGVESDNDPHWRQLQEQT